MKIAVLIRNYNRYAGGAERYCVELTELLAKSHEVHVFSQNHQVNSELIKFHNIPKIFEKPRFINQLFFSWVTKRATLNNFDIIHSHELVSHADIYTIHVPCFKSILLNISGTKKILRVLNTIISPRKLAYLMLEKKQMQSNSFRSFISVSEFLSRNIQQCYPAITNISIASPGLNFKKSKNISFDLKNKLSIPKNAFLLLLVAKEYKKKGLPTIQKAMEYLQNKDIYLIVVGGKKQKKSSIPKKIKSHIHFLGEVDNIDVIYPQVDILVHPTLSDTFGMAPLEAMSFKIPIIISNSKFCGLSEYLNNSQALFLENPKDEIELAKKISLLYENRNERIKLAHNGYAKSLELNWKNTLEKTLLAYNSITKK
jgi:UDP-glucose:(heptosyl)LPS alpha-1,3-glucosyltransferase